MILTDKQIIERVKISPLVKCKMVGNGISYGLNPFGYDIRLSPNDFRIFRNDYSSIIDPKNFDPEALVNLELIEDSYFILPAYSYALGVAMEYIEMPNDISALCSSKSTYVRSGIVQFLTPIEAGWRGYLTLEMANCSPKDCKVYAYEGIAQIQFFSGTEMPLTSYGNGKYQNQLQEITLAKSNK